MSDSLMGSAPGAAPSEGAAPTTETTTTMDNQSNVTLDEGVKAPEWLPEGVDESVQLDPSLRAIKDLPTLVKSYVHAQKQMGKKGVQIPTKDSSREEWDAFYQKMGKPTTLEEFTVNKAEDAVASDEFLNEFKQKAFENNLLPNQAQAMFDFLNAHTVAGQQALEAQKQEEIEAGVNKLRQEWGEAFDQNLHKARAAVDEFGGDQFRAYLTEMGLDNDPTLVKAFAKIGETFLKEDNFTGDSKPSYALSPEEAQQKINGYMADFNGPYYNKQHADHNRVVQEVQKLFKAMG